MPVWIWFVAAGVLGVAELLTGTFYMLILAVAACFGAAASLLGFGATIQVVVAAVAASLGCGYLWRRHKAGRLAEKPGLKTARHVYSTGGRNGLRRQCQERNWCRDAG